MPTLRVRPVIVLTFLASMLLTSTHCPNIRSAGDRAKSLLAEGPATIGLQVCLVHNELVLLVAYVAPDVVLQGRGGEGVV